jgi:DNA-binding FadR family transcriptional regulator
MEARKATRPLRLGSLAAAKTPAALAEALRERILGGELREGTPLPPEREMVGETGLGRGSVREALRLLEAEGLIRTKTGRHGGTFTTLPDESGLTHYVSLFVRGRRVPIRALLEARTTIEPSLAYFAALNRTDGDVAELKKACADMEAAGDGEAFGRHNLAWHYAVAAASHNELLVAFLASIASAIGQASAAHAEAFEASPFDDIRAAVVRAHRGITDAVERGQPDAAKRRMERHLRAYTATATSTGPDDVAVEVV